MKEQMINIRVNGEVKEALARRAYQMDMSLSKFMLYCSTVVCREIDETEGGYYEWAKDSAIRNLPSMEEKKLR